MKKKISIILIFISMFIACDKPKNIYNYLDHSIWFKYHLHDTLKYNSYSNINIYVITNLYTAYEEYDNKYFNEYFCVQYYCLSDSVYPPIYGFCRKKKEIIINTRDSWTGTSYMNGEKINYQLGDSLIQNVFKIESSRVDSNYYPVKTYYYSDIYGIIRYDMYNDEVFELQLK